MLFRSHDLGNAYLKTGKLYGNATSLFHLIRQEKTEIPPGLAETRAFVETELAALGNARMQRSDAALVRDEFANAGRLLRHACERGLGAPAAMLAGQMREIVSEHRRLWLARNRPGGLPDSVRAFEERLKEYERG